MQKKKMYIFLYILYKTPFSKHHAIFIQETRFEEKAILVTSLEIEISL